MNIYGWEASHIEINDNKAHQIWVLGYTAHKVVGLYLHKLFNDQ